jgi:stearoyl-CoA desaturase (delta-9 desaturase)
MASPAAKSPVNGAQHKKFAGPQIWWSNATFFVSVHIAALVGMYYFPPTAVAWQTLVLAFLTWQLADFGITIGYHRLYSHRAFRATYPVRLSLALLGSAAFQGSIKWW